MACGSARLLADLIAAKTPDIKAQDLSMLRYANKWPSKNQI
jgi:glycine/D-amino acid oxidase-like deaminating enzyme